MSKRRVNLNNLMAKIATRQVVEVEDKSVVKTAEPEGQLNKEAVCKKKAAEDMPENDKKEEVKSEGDNTPVVKTKEVKDEPKYENIVAEVEKMMEIPMEDVEPAEKTEEEKDEEENNKKASYYNTIVKSVLDGSISNTKYSGVAEDVVKLIYDSYLK